MKQEVYILVAVFVVILVILVWMGFRMIMSLRQTTRRRPKAGSFNYFVCIFAA